jgi:hypothetical protein
MTSAVPARDEFRSVERAARSAISDHDVISFDVFDTAIFRAIARPTDVFLLLTLKLMASPEALHHPEIINGFPELRIHAEEQARCAWAAPAGVRGQRLSSL